MSSTSSIPLMLVGLAGIVVGLGSLVCFIIVLIKLFQQKGALHGILGIICALYPFVWGWIESPRLGIKNIMLIWTALLIVGIVLQGIGTVFGVGTAKAMQEEVLRQ